MPVPSPDARWCSAPARSPGTGPPRSSAKARCPRRSDVKDIGVGSCLNSKVAHSLRLTGEAMSKSEMFCTVSVSTGRMTLPGVDLKVTVDVHSGYITC